MTKKKAWLITLAGAFALMAIGAVVVYQIKTMSEVSVPEEPVETESVVATPAPSPTPQETPEQTLDIPIDFEALQAQNADIYAWITIPGTVIDYPIVQSSEDNAYYLTHTIDGEVKTSASIYTQNYNSKTFEDPITVVYGHNMKDGSMFAGLHQYKDLTFFEANQEIIIYQPDAILTYQIFAAYQTSDEHILWAYNFGETEQDCIFYVNDILNQRTMSAHVDKTAPVDADSKILTLSTCDSAGDTYRYVVQAYLVQVETIE